MTRTLFECWDEVDARIRASGRVLLACDFDGTLAPIVERPEDARILPECAEALREIASLPAFEVAVISGRALVDVRARVGLSEAVYSGNHGMEIEGTGLSAEDETAAAARMTMRDIARSLASAIAAIPGAFVEDKGLSLSIHYRLTPDDLEPEVEARAREALAEPVAGGQVIIVQGKKVLDIRSASARDKGAALRFLMEILDRRGDGEAHMPIYLGDDRTDEDAFRAANRADGISVYVGPGGWGTDAMYQLDAPADVALFLQRLVAGARGQPGNSV